MLAAFVIALMTAAVSTSETSVSYYTSWRLPQNAVIFILAVVKA
jgi:hypothetical protein